MLTLLISAIRLDALVMMLSMYQKYALMLEPAPKLLV